MKSESWRPKHCFVFWKMMFQHRIPCINRSVRRLCKEERQRFIVSKYKISLRKGDGSYFCCKIGCTFTKIVNDNIQLFTRMFENASRIRPWSGWYIRFRINGRRSARKSPEPQFIYFHALRQESLYSSMLPRFRAIAGREAGFFVSTVLRELASRQSRSALV